MRQDRPTEGSRFVRLFAASALVLAAGLLPASGAECDAWCSQAAPEKGLDLTAAAYQVDAYGALALGRLTLEFRNGGPTPITAQYRLPSAFPLRIEAVRLTVDDREIAESDDPQSSDPQASDPQSAGPQSAGPQSTGPQSTSPQATGPQPSGPQPFVAQAFGPRSPGPRSSGPRSSRNQPSQRGASASSCRRRRCSI